jgi:hypothetical protein
MLLGRRPTAGSRGPAGGSAAARASWAWLPHAHAAHPLREALDRVLRLLLLMWLLRQVLLRLLLLLLRLLLLLCLLLRAG